MMEKEMTKCEQFAPSEVVCPEVLIASKCAHVCVMCPFYSFFLTFEQTSPEIEMMKPKVNAYFAIEKKLPLQGRPHHVF